MLSGPGKVEAYLRAGRPRTTPHGQHGGCDRPRVAVWRMGYTALPVLVGYQRPRRASAERVAQGMNCAGWNKPVRDIIAVLVLK